MQNKIKRIFSLVLVFILCGFMILGLVGCAPVGGTKLNAKRGKKYDYDFVQFLDAKVYGANGYGFLDIKPKDLSVSDFKSEKEYITIKKLVNAMKLYIDPNNKDRDSYLTASQTSGLKNGDIVTLSISSDFELPEGAPSINLEPYEFEVQQLKDPIDLDLFDSSSVDFVGIEGTTTIYPVKIHDGAVPNDILDHIVYTATTDDKTLETGKTILSVSAELDQDSLKEEDPDNTDTSDQQAEQTLATYLGKQNYVSEVTGEKVLVDMAKEAEFNSSTNKTIRNILLKAIRNVDNNIMDVATIQQSLTNSSSDENKFNYLVTYYAYPSDTADLQNGSVCMATNVTIANTKAGISVLGEPSNPSRTSNDACLGLLNGYVLKANYNTALPSAASSASPDALRQTNN